MLVLKREAGEAIVITTPEGRQILVAVAHRSQDGKFRLAFDADPDVVIDRLEIHDAKGSSATVSADTRDFLVKCGNPSSNIYRGQR